MASKKRKVKAKRLWLVEGRGWYADGDTEWDDPFQLRVKAKTLKKAIAKVVAMLPAHADAERLVRADFTSVSLDGALHVAC